MLVQHATGVVPAYMPVGFVYCPVECPSVSAATVHSCQLVEDVMREISLFCFAIVLLCAGTACLLPSRCVLMHAPRRPRQVCTLPAPLSQGHRPSSQQGTISRAAKSRRSKKSRASAVYPVHHQCLAGQAGQIATWRCAGPGGRPCAAHQPPSLCSGLILGCCGMLHILQITYKYTTAAACRSWH